MLYSTDLRFNLDQQNNPRFLMSMFLIKGKDLFTDAVTSIRGFPTISFFRFL
jgi:hypothetical protein